MEIVVEDFKEKAKLRVVVWSLKLGRQGDQYGGSLLAELGGGWPLGKEIGNESWPMQKAVFLGRRKSNVVLTYAEEAWRRCLPTSATC